MIKLVLAIGFLAVFGFVAYAIAVRIWPKEPKENSNNSQPKNKNNAKRKS